MPQVQWNDLSPGGKRLEEIRFELGYLERKEFAKFLSLHPTDYCHILHNDRLSIRRLVNIFRTLIEAGYYQHFKVVLYDLNLFDDAYFYIPSQKTLLKKGIIKTLQGAYAKSRKSV